jgi:hypothetical protein
LDKKKDPAPDTTPKPETSPRKSERLAEEKKPHHSTRFVSKMGGAYILKDFEASDVTGIYVLKIAPGTWLQVLRLK